MKRLLLVILGWALLSAPAYAYTTDQRLDQFASIFAMREVEVYCYDKLEAGSPYLEGAWGYVYIPLARQTAAHLDGRLCEGALRVNDTSLPRWQRTLGVAVIVHESYHLRRWGAAGNEAKVQCKTIRNFKVAARLLGATEETVEDLWPMALAVHYRLAGYRDWTGRRPYYDPKCQVPHYLPPEVLDE